MPSNTRGFTFTGARLTLDRSLPSVEFPSLTLRITARSQSDRHPARYEYERCWSCEVLIERGFSRIRDGGSMPPPESPGCGTSFLRWHMPSSPHRISHLGISPQLRPSGYFRVTSSIGRIKHFERTSSSFCTLPSVLASDCGSIILLLEESQPAALNRVLTNPACCRCCLSCRVVSV